MSLTRTASLGLAFMTLLGLGVSDAQAQTTLYGQPAYILGDYHWNFLLSSSNAISFDGNLYGPFIAYDNFSLTSTAQIGTVNWQGLTVADPSFGRGHQGNEPSTFTIDFLSDNKGLPGALIDSQTVSATKSFVTSGNLYDDNSLINIYSYSATLAATPALQGDTQYWISIAGNAAGSSAWCWTSGQPGDASSYQINGTNSSQTGFNQYDRAFSLGSAPAAVPEASTTFSFGLLLCLGLGRLVVSTRRRKGQASV